MRHFPWDIIHSRAKSYKHGPYTYIHTYIHTYKHTYKHTYHLQRGMCQFMWGGGGKYVRMEAYVSTDTYASRHAYIHTYIHIHTHTYMHLPLKVC